MRALFLLAIIFIIVQAQLDCEATISSKLAEFKKLPLEKRHDVLEKLYFQIRNLYPQSTDEGTKKFMTAMFFQENTPAYLCKLSETTIGTMIFHKVEKKKEEPNPFCVFGC